MAFVTTPRILGAGQRIELVRTIRAEWTEASTDPRKVLVTARRDAEAHVNEEVLATDRDAVTRLSSRWPAWRDAVSYDGAQIEDTSLAGGAFQLEVAGKRPRVVGAVTPAQQRALELEYSTLGTPTAIDRTARVIADGMTVRDIGSLVLALLLRHLRGPGVYTPSMTLDANATLVGTANDIATFDVVIDPADPTRTEELRLRGQLALGTEGWPRSLSLAGTCVRRIASRFETKTQDGTASVTATWRYS